MPSQITINFMFHAGLFSLKHKIMENKTKDEYLLTQKLMTVQNSESRRTHVLDTDTLSSGLHICPNNV